MPGRIGEGAEGGLFPNSNSTSQREDPYLRNLSVDINAEGGGVGRSSCRTVVEGERICSGRSRRFFRTATETGPFLHLCRLLHCFFLKLTYIHFYYGSNVSREGSNY